MPEPISIEPEAILARLMERLPQYINDPRTTQLLGELAMRDAAISQLQARIAELEGQATAGGATSNGDARGADLVHAEPKLS